MFTSFLKKHFAPEVVPTESALADAENVAKIATVAADVFDKLVVAYGNQKLVMPSAFGTALGGNLYRMPKTTSVDDVVVVAVSIYNRAFARECHLAYRTADVIRDTMTTALNNGR